MNKISVFALGLCCVMPAMAIDYAADAIEKRDGLFYVKETHQPLTGTLIRTYPDGKKLAESVFVDGILNGESRGFQESGKLDHQIEFKNNLKEGHYKQYDLTGTLRIEGTYAADKLTDTLKIYYPSGKIQVTETYKNGLLNGERIEYYETGAIKNKAVFADNLLDGVYREFYADGTLQSETTFQNGMRNGSAKVFYPNGAIQLEMTFAQNKLTGENKQYDAAGHIKESRVYRDGVIVDGFTLKNGEQTKLTQKQLDELNSKTILHTPENTYKKEGILYDTKTHKAISGIFRVLRENGTTQEEYEFLNGRPHGIAQLFDDNGHLTQQNLFNNGVKISYRLMDNNGVVIKTCQIDEKGTEDCKSF